MNRVVFLLEKDKTKKQTHNQYKESESKISSENKTYNVMPQLQFLIPVFQ